MSDKIDETVRLQLENFAQSIRKSTGADVAAIVLGFDQESCVASDLKCQDTLHSANMLRAMIVGTYSMLHGATAGGAKLFIEVNGVQHDARDYFNPKRVIEGSFDDDTV